MILNQKIDDFITQKEIVMLIDALKMQQEYLKKFETTYVTYKQVKNVLKLSLPTSSADKSR